MNKAILIHEKKDQIEEIDLDIGQWPDIDVVIVKPTSGMSKNENNLPYPFSSEEVYGKILLIRMDKDSEPRDFTLKEYQSFSSRNKRLNV
jgi:hypothetical protein